MDRLANLEYKVRVMSPGVFLRDVYNCVVLYSFVDSAANHGREWWGPKVNYKACSFRIRDLSISEKFVGWRRTCITGFFSGKGFDISSYWTFNSQDRG
jgi:hypothetical protein